MEGLDLGEFPDAVRLSPLGETAGGIEVGLARVALVELLGEKVADAFGGFRGRREEPDREHWRGGRGGEQVLAHFFFSVRTAMH
jgi:hypothetical protein